MADGQPVIIEELEGDRRSIVLADSDLPQQGFEVGASLRIVSTQYPGTSDKSTQILGTAEDDINFTTRFSDVLTGEIGSAQAQNRRLRAILLGQRFCELRWGSTLVRRGYLKAVRTKYFRESVLVVVVTFHVDEADEPEIIAPAPPATATSEDVLRAVDVLSDALAALQTAGEAVTLIRAIT